jgi:ankyrin repeat domain-containing protein 50
MRFTTMLLLLHLCWLAILSFPVAVHGDGWDDFSNNLAVDLAPALALFGEQTTKQYLSESITLLDYFIFAMAPIGILTAIVSAIRVCGSPSLRAFIGRAQEVAGVAEAELCSSTSRDVCELYNNGGISRVFGRPKLLEVVFDPDFPQAADDTSSSGSDEASTGIYTFHEYLKTPHGQQEWTKVRVKTKKQDEESHNLSGSEVNNSASSRADQPFAPNLSLNVGI